MKYDFDAVIDRSGSGAIKWERNYKFQSIEPGRKINPFWIADMDFPCAQPIVEALKHRAAHPVYGYTYFDQGEFFKSVSEWYSRRYGWSVKTKDIFYAPGVVFAIGSLINAFSNLGDGIVIQTPVYYPFKKLIKANGRRVVESSLVKDVKNSGRYVMDYADLELKVSAPDVSMMILCSPHNPVGRVWSERELSRVSDICENNNVLLISDEIHGDLVRDGIRFIPAAIAGNPENLITCSAPSKSFNIPGLMVSTVIIQNDKYRKGWEMEAYNKTGLSLPNPMGAVAMKAAYEGGEEWLEQVNEYIDGNLFWMKKYVDENLVGVGYDVPEGTYLAWMDFNNTAFADDRKLADRLETEYGILVDPGYIFGKQGKGFIRINVACPRSRLADLFEKIEMLLITA